METNFLSGWDNESELEDFRELMNYQEYCGEQFLYDWEYVRERIYGTNKKLVLDKKTGWYRLSGSTMHCMSWSLVRRGIHL